MSVLNSMVRKLTRDHRDLRACKCNYIGTCGPMSALNLMAGKLVGLLRDLQVHV